MLTCMIKIRMLQMTRSTSETVRQLSEILKANRFVASASLENFMGYPARGFFFFPFFLLFIFHKNV